MGDMTKTKKQRDPRLDFFRGVAMLIIFLAHVPWNPWANYIPARFGFSDGAEMFVFCSGFAAAIAFGGTYQRAGFGLGTLRIGYRIWQIYIAHIAMFFFIAMLTVAGTKFFGDADYVTKLNLSIFFDNAADLMIGLFTLTYVPNFFDILPMYMVALAMVPALMVLARIHPLLAVAGSVAVYVANWVFDGGLPAEPWSDREWFFNPFGWQLIFFTGFALSIGWIKAPTPTRALTIAAIVFVVAAIPLAHWPIWREFSLLAAWHADLKPWAAKTDYGILRWVHFMALAYLAVTFLKGREHLLRARIVQPIITVGQQALPVFLLSMFMAQATGMLLDQTGRDAQTITIVNLTGFAIIIGFAQFLTWMKSTPWKRMQPATPKPTVTERRDDPAPVFVAYPAE
ncbi:MAG: OpgC domain-containing protein [Rhodospirillaceae bacterium]|nr:OpgC domain-containing protein [Rhodospirillaceae bacterium]MBT6136575.1 OpgC domain-containing protein [Rhodospirillaceae bacterium]